ncbi:hypothetical protein LXL04_027182 [Taraxacum kok-saghyz]
MEKKAKLGKQLGYIERRLTKTASTIAVLSSKSRLHPPSLSSLFSTWKQSRDRRFPSSASTSAGSNREARSNRDSSPPFLFSPAPASSKLRSFENSYIPENPRTHKPLTFTKNRLREAKNRSNTSPSLYNTYLKSFVKNNLKKNAKKKVSHMQKIKKEVAHMQKLKKKWFFGIFCLRSGLLGREEIRHYRDRIDTPNERFSSFSDKILLHRNSFAATKVFSGLVNGSGGLEEPLSAEK